MPTCKRWGNKICSIAGVYFFKTRKGVDNLALRKKLIKAMKTLESRGPDDRSIVEISDGFLMAGNRLIIRGDKKNGKIPFLFKGVTTFYNGEIYNFKEFGGGYASDGEIIPILYKKYKERFLDLIKGEFAISLWDEEEKRLILARDPFGSKPLYFSINGERVIWASSEAAINSIEKHPFCESVKGPTYKHSYSVQEPYTSLSGVWCVPPGHFLEVKNDKVSLVCYNKWCEPDSEISNESRIFSRLSESLKERMDYKGTIGIPFSAGIDSGIIAFTADMLGMDYHLFSVTSIFGEETAEAPYIRERISKLKNPRYTLIDFGEEEYMRALDTIYSDGYYFSERFDNGNLLMYSVFEAMSEQGIKVCIDGSGGDELFNGYKFSDDFQPVAGWPSYWKRDNSYYGLFSTLLDYTAKSDRAGAYFSIESRYPYQDKQLFIEAMLNLKGKIPKEVLRKFLLRKTKYGTPLEVDIKEKFGFSIKNMDKSKMRNDMRAAWCKKRFLEKLPEQKPQRFPFKIGDKSELSL